MPEDSDADPEADALAIGQQGLLSDSMDDGAMKDKKADRPWLKNVRTNRHYQMFLALCHRNAVQLGLCTDDPAAQNVTYFSCADASAALLKGFKSLSKILCALGTEFVFVGCTSLGVRLLSTLS